MASKMRRASARAAAPASAGVDTQEVSPQGDSAAEAILLAGKRTGRGTRVGNSEIEIPGVPRTEFA